MKRILFVGIILVLGFSSSVYSQGREKININNDWKFIKGDYSYGYSENLIVAGWEKVDLPHTWNVWDSFDDRDPSGDPDFEIAEYYYRGPGWYRKNIFIPGSDKGKRIFIEFEAANAVANVWVNEIEVGNHIGGYSGFKFDITNQIKFDEENIIAVRADNSYNYDIPPQRADYTMYGGIYRDVYIIKTNQSYFEKNLISTSTVNGKKAEVRITSYIKNNLNENFEGIVKISLSDPDGKVILKSNVNANINNSEEKNIASDKFIIANPKLWSPDHPNIYTAEIKLEKDGEIIDEVTEHFGLRWFSMDADEGFSLNGEYLKMKGVNRHQDRYGYGNALPNELHREDFKMIKEMGANFVRLAHYQQDPVVLDMCDSLGLLVWEEIPVVTSVGKEKFKENAKVMLREMITQHYNHPSIIIWGLMNETVRTQPDDQLYINVEICKELSELADQLDPYRLTAQAQMLARGEDILKYSDIRGWNKYWGWYYGEFEDFGPFMDEKREVAPDQPCIISEYGAGSKRGFHMENPTFPDFSEDWALQSHQSHWKQISDRKWIAGSAVWNMFDFASDEKAGNIPHINQKGLASFDRQPKDVYYFYQSVWSDKPMVYIVSHTWLEREGKENETKRLEVLSNCEEVELFLNGESLGKDSDSSFVWNVRFKPGENKIKAEALKEGIKVTDEIKINYSIAE